MIEQYVSTEEYPTYFSKLNGLRSRIVSDFPIEPDKHILDLATGYGFFAIELAKFVTAHKIVGIDLSQNDILIARKKVVEHNLADRIEIINRTWRPFSESCTVHN